MPKVTATPARPISGRVLPSISVHIEFQPIRETTTSADIAYELNTLLAQVTHAKYVERGHASNHRWGLGDPEYMSYLSRDLTCRGLVNTEEAADTLGVTVATVRRWVKAGRFGTDIERGAGGIILLPWDAVLTVCDEVGR